MTSSLATLPDGARLAVHTEGEGPALLLVSGLGGTAAFWSPLLPLLAPRFRVIRFDQRGIGASTRGSAPVTIDRLADVSRGLSRLLDNETDMTSAYRLEVTSPGLERDLRRPSHYAKSIGREVVVKVADGDQKTTIRGILSEAGDDEFTVDAGDERKTVEYENVLTARTVFRWEKAPKPGH